MVNKIEYNNNNRYCVEYMAKLEYYYHSIKDCNNDKYFKKLNVPTICTYITNVNNKLCITDVLKELYHSIDENILNNNIENDIFVLTFKNYYNCDTFEFNFTYDVIKATEVHLRDTIKDIFFVHQVCENSDNEIFEINLYCYQKGVHKIGTIANMKQMSAIEINQLYIDKKLNL